MYEIEICRVAALAGAPTQTIQNLLWQFARSLGDEGFRIAGVVEEAYCGEEGGCKRLAVRDLASDEVFSITQNLGAGSTACNLNPGGLAKACEIVERSVRDGADVVILSKFGKLEAARTGLCDAFRAAILADIPIITSVSPNLREEWTQFAGPLSEEVFATREALDAWWRTRSPQFPPLTGFDNHSMSDDEHKRSVLA